MALRCGVSGIAVLVALLWPGAAPAGTAYWPARHLLQVEPSGGPGSPAPSAAIAADGTLAVSYRHAARPAAVRVAVSDGTARVTLIQRLDRFNPAKLAAAPGGRVVAVVSREHELVAFVRPGRGTRFGRAIRIAEVTDGRGALFDFGVAADVHGNAVVTWVDRASRHAPNVLRARTLSRSGRRGPARALGSSEYLASAAPAVSGEGHAAIAWSETDGRGMAVTPTVHLAVSNDLRRGFRAPEAGAVAPGVDPDVAVDSDGRVALSYLRQDRGGDAGSRGRPVLQVKPPGAALGRVLEPPVPRGRGLLPQVAFAAGGHPVLVYQVKDRVSGFSIAAPVWSTMASVTGEHLSKPRLIDSRQVTRPSIGALDGGVLVLSAAPTWKAAVISHTGRRIAEPTPQGAAYPFADANGNRALATAGKRAVLVWEQKSPDQRSKLYASAWRRHRSTTPPELHRTLAVGRPARART